MNTSFDIFWDAYDKKVGKDKAEPKWYRLPASDQVLIMNHVHKFVAKQRNKQFRPNPLSYLNGKMWLDENVGTEQTPIYRTPQDKPLSTYEAKEFPRSEGINHMRQKLKDFYDNRIPIKDWGGIYTALLIEKCNMTVSEKMSKLIEAECREEAERPRNRFEPQYKGNVESDIRDMRLKYFLEQSEKEDRIIYLEI